MTKHRTGTSSAYGVAGDGELAKGSASRPGLVLLYAPNFEQLAPAYVFDVPELTIGRDTSNPVCVPEQAVSREHARIAFDGTRWLLRDLGSRNGTMVDGQYIHEVELQSLHEIRVGDAIFKFVESGAERYLHYRLDGAMTAPRRRHQLDELSAARRWTRSPPRSSASRPRRSRASSSVRPARAKRSPRAACIA
jgi:predicted component of type VI protein secretion system